MTTDLSDLQQDMFCQIVPIGPDLPMTVAPTRVFDEHDHPRLIEDSWHPQAQAKFTTFPVIHLM